MLCQSNSNSLDGERRFMVLHDNCMFMHKSDSNKHFKDAIDYSAVNWTPKEKIIYN